MAVDTKILVSALKKKRESEGLSLRSLSPIVGVSFSSLARIERGDGEPDNNSLIRILEWLGDDARSEGLTFENVALVHFRAAKNASSRTIHSLLKAADALKASHNDSNADNGESLPSPSDPSDTLPLSKPELEAMADKLRSDLGLHSSEPLDALSVEIEGVEVFVPSELKGLEDGTVSHLYGDGRDDWSAMSVPLNAQQDRWAVLRNDRHTIERQRVTYLEECWHILLEHKLTKISKVADAYGRTYDSNEEHDAFYLASASLLPQGAIERSVSERHSAMKIAADFGVSPELVEYRIKRLGLWLDYKAKAVKLAHSS